MRSTTRRIGFRARLGPRMNTARGDSITPHSAKRSAVSGGFTSARKVGSLRQRSRLAYFRHNRPLVVAASLASNRSASTELRDSSKNKNISRGADRARSNDQPRYTRLPDRDRRRRERGEVRRRMLERRLCDRLLLPVVPHGTARPHPGVGGAFAPRFEFAAAPETNEELRRL